MPCRAVGISGHRPPSYLYKHTAGQGRAQHGVASGVGHGAVDCRLKEEEEFALFDKSVV